MAGQQRQVAETPGSPGSHEGPWDLARCSHQHETVDTGIDTELLVGPVGKEVDGALEVRVAAVQAQGHGVSGAQEVREGAWAPVVSGAALAMVELKAALEEV